MVWLQSLDTALFRFINQRLSNPAFDAVMPQLSNNSWFLPALALFLIGLLWKGDARARLFILMIALLIPLGDATVINTIKEAIGRPRPFHVVSDAILRVGKGNSESMPSSHASSWCAAALIAFVYYRGSWRFMAPFAVVMGFSRVYLGVHYPSDVVIGAILGTGYAIAALWALNALWRTAGRHWFPLWWNRLPSLVISAPRQAGGRSPAVAHEPAAADLQWLRLGYLVIALLFIGRLLYLGSGRIELSEDEAYQWLWSKHLALSYYSKPPMIALAQFAGTTICGDREIGVRILSPVISAVLSLSLLRFMHRSVGAPAAFWTVLICSTAPLLAVGSTLMTVDPLLVLFWTAAMIVGWRAVQPAGTTGQWLAVGLLMGLGFLSKYTAAIQLACFALFFVLQPSARVHLRRGGPWLALGVFALCTLPVVIWNGQHGWITIQHVGENAKLDKPWEPTLAYFFEFVVSEAGLMNPVFFVASIWAMFAFWRRRNEKPLLAYLFAMSAPVFFGYWLYSLHSRILPNWIAAAVVPMFCLMIAYWSDRWPEKPRAFRAWLITGLVVGAVAVLICHDTSLVHKLTKRRLPAKVDPLRRVNGWKETAHAVGEARSQLLADGKDVFIIGSHYGVTGQISFYLPEARRGLPDNPLVYYRTSAKPRNQFYFWPGYRDQVRFKGANAIYVDEAPLPKLKRGWLRTWLAGGTDFYEPDLPSKGTLPREVSEEFESVTNLGVREIKERGQVLRRIQLFACRNLR